ncbi:MAG: helical backbone metal receptor, partial [Desulfobacteraceae bacterium]|nr:helical backbone metal receptor [Desulfobacteraceae bacterium]
MTATVRSGDNPKREWIQMRIVSLTPSITETLFAIDAQDCVVGVTDACDHPPEANDKPHVCAWFDPDVERIAALKPDVVAGLAAAHRRISSAVSAMGARLMLFSPATVEDALDDMIRLGEAIERAGAARALVQRLRVRLAHLDEAVAEIPEERRLRVSRVLEAENGRVMLAGPHSFQYDVIARGGGRNITGGIDQAYPWVDFDRFCELDPDLVFFCGTDPRRIRKLAADRDWRRLQAVRRGRLYQFDCGLTCRTGPRIVDMAELLFRTLTG